MWYATFETANFDIFHRHFLTFRPRKTYDLMTIVHTADTDKTRLPRVVRVLGVSRIGDKSTLSATGYLDSVLSSLEMRWGLLKTVLVANSVHTTSPPTRKDSLVMSCHWCELGISDKTGSDRVSVLARWCQAQNDSALGLLLLRLIITISQNDMSHRECVGNSVICQPVIICC